MKKLTKILTLTAATIGAAIIPMTTVSSCSHSANDVDVDEIPTEYLDIQDSVLYGFTNDWNPTETSKYSHLVVPSNVIAIAPNAFSGGGVQHTIPNSINTLSFQSEQNTDLLFIGDSAFKGCDSLKTICLPNRLSNVDSNAFRDCSNVITLDLSEWSAEKYDNNSVFSGSFIFDGWQSNGTIISNSEKKVNLYFMMKETGLNKNWYNVDFEVVSDGTFRYWVADGEKILVQVDSYDWKEAELNVIPKDVTMIAPRALRGIWSGAGSGSHTVKVEADSQLKIIYSYAFENNSYNFVKIDLSTAKNLKTLDNHAFNGCSNLNEVVLPKETTLQSIGTSCFISCYNLQKIGDGEGGDATINVRAICDDAFSTCRKLTTLSVSNIEWVGRRAFSGSGIQGEIEFEPSLKYIGHNAFKDCTGITGINCDKNTSNLMHIADNAFNGCSSLTGTLSLPKSLVYIGEAAFIGTKITGFDIHADNPYYMNGDNDSGDRCIYVKNGSASPEILLTACSETTTVKTTIRRIANYAFANIVLDETTEILDLRELTNLESVGDHAFEGVTRSGDDKTFVVKLPDNTSMTLGSYCFANSTIDDINIGDLSGIKEIGSYAFYKCNSLTEVVIPTNIDSIPAFAFKGCESLAKVTIPSNIKKIGDRAFDQCYYLVNLYLPGFTDLPEWDDTIASFNCYLKVDAYVHFPNVCEGQKEAWRDLIQNKLKYSGYPKLPGIDISFNADL